MIRTGKVVRLQAGSKRLSWLPLAASALGLLGTLVVASHLAHADSVAYQMNLAHDGAATGTGIAPPLAPRWSVDLPGTTS